jgi:hypothetical protein
VRHPIGILHGVEVELVADDAVLEAALVVIFDVDDGLLVFDDWWQFLASS